MWVAGPSEAAATAVAELRRKQPGLAVLGPDEARDLCPELRPGWITAALVEPNAQDIDVAGLHQSYVRRTRAAGATIVTGAALVAAERERKLWRLALENDSRTVTAEVVINAAGAWADQVAALFGARPVGLRPLRRTIAIARRANAVLGPGAPLVADVADGFYYRPEGPQVLVSPADETPSEPCDARPDEAGVALALDRVGEATTLGLRSVVTAWAGLRTFAPDRVPVAGFDPDVPGLFWLAGQGGYGIQTAPALARLAAASVRKGTAATTVAHLDPTALWPARLH
jgi:D-arginine dehydrogenase